MTELRTVFLGNDPWSAVALEASVNAEEPMVPAAVFTRRPKPAGRGSSLRPTEVAVAARRLGLPLIEVDTVREGEGLDALKASRPEVLIVVAYGEILGPEILGLPRLGCINLHFSLLPRWRGASPVQRAIQAGDRVSGVTIILMDEGLDTGPVLTRTEVAIDPTEDAGSLGERLASVGGGLVAALLPPLAEGAVKPTPQAAEGVTFAPKLTSEDRIMRWTEAASEIDRRVRAVSPTPGATTSFRHEVLKVARGVEASGDAAPGVIVGIDAGSGGVDVGTAEGIYRLLEVVPAGRKRMPADAWARGVRFTPGERFDAS